MLTVMRAMALPVCPGGPAHHTIALDHLVDRIPFEWSVRRILRRLTNAKNMMDAHEEFTVYKLLASV